MIYILYIYINAVHSNEVDNDNDKENDNDGKIHMKQFSFSIFIFLAVCLSSPFQVTICNKQCVVCNNYDAETNY